MKNDKITSKDVDFAKWYTDIVTAAKLVSYSEVKGCNIILPNGYAIWEEMQKGLDKSFKSTGHKNVYMPLLIPESLLNKESELVSGFAPEVAWVTHGGDKELEEKLCIRPTSETLFSDYYSKVVKSYRDLPLKYNQWCNVLRWEKETRPFLRGREFLWQEGHTVHENSIEAEKETRDILEIYKKFFTDYLAIPVITGRKTEKEKFAGAEYTLTVEALMYNGVCLQSATSHYFGQKFSKSYDIKFLNRENNYEYAYQTSWGTTTRMIGAVIMVHADDLGLVLPPNIAPTKVCIIPIGTDEKVSSVTTTISEKLAKENISYMVDDSDKTPGFKFAESEVNGIPVRIEIGKRDLENNTITMVRRDTLEHISVSLDEDIMALINKLLLDIQRNLYNKAKSRMESMTFEAKTIEDFKNIINTQPGFIKSSWCGKRECEDKIKEINGIKSRCILENEELTSSKCPVCGEEAKEEVVWGIQY